MKTILYLLRQKYISCFRNANKEEIIMENTHFVSGKIQLMLKKIATIQT